MNILKRKAKRLGVPIFYVNMVGGQDELVFDGESLAVDREGRLIGIGKQFEEDLIIIEIDADHETPETTAPSRTAEQEILDALVLGVRDYFRKTGLWTRLHWVERRHRFFVSCRNRRRRTR